MYNRLFLDSGAFSADKSGSPINLTDYIKFIHENKDQIEVYANLDVIGDWEATWENQKIMEAEGLKPLPVHHLEDPMKCLDWCLEYDYFALGGIAGGASMKDRIRFFDKCWDVICDEEGTPKSKVHGFGMASPQLVNQYPWHCMTEEDHEVLTKKGWKFRKDLKIGEEILCFDEGKTLWEPILDIPTFGVVNAPIHIIQNRNFKAKVTGEHKWIVSSQRSNEKGIKWGWRTTEHMYNDDVIPRVGENYDFPKKKKYSNELVALMGWYWTDGTHKVRTKYKHDAIGISQSLDANPEKCKNIDFLLKNEKHCSWIAETNLQSWELYGEISKKLLKIAPHKKIPLSFIFDLTKEQLELFIKSSVLGDGSKTNLVRQPDSWIIRVSREVKKENLEVLRIGCLLLGIPTSISGKEKGWKNLQTSSVDWVYCNKLSEKIEKYTGNLWCVQVPSKAFFTRCSDKIYVTGNSIDSSSWVAYGRYGIVIMPRVKEDGYYDYFSPPVKIFVTDRSPKKSDDGLHYNNLSPHEQWLFDRFIEFHKLPFGIGLKDDENFVPGVSNDNFWRDLMNYIFFASMCKMTKQYPWKWRRPDQLGNLF